MSLLYDVRVYKYFILLFINGFFKIFKKRKFQLCVLVIYLSINSHVGLDYDSIYTIILLFLKYFGTFFPFGIVLLDFTFYF